ncbi:alpha/beta fold hydrolase [Sphingomonas endolithica]|uniref:alpha/beta fold hydrolase n=1 Tax=Sphingomonas endolithica TaxID=2972485 RepID=UPI0021AE5894|nr:alpha/beta hydrolase [Sphingomonas sp. ZFBP2030]
MITHLKARLLATAFTLLVVLHPAAAHCQTTPAPTDANSALRIDPVMTQMEHISIATAGRGSPVILIPGLSSARAVWDDVVPVLARTHRVYLVQVNGFGGDAPGKNLQPGMLDGIVADLDRFVTEHKITRPAIVGHSMGGLVALMWTKAHPDHVARAMIVDSLPYVGEIFVPGATVEMMAPQAATMRDRMVASYGKPADSATAEATANGLALKPTSRGKVKAWVLAADPRVAGQALYEDLTTDLRPDMANITTPLTIVYPWSDALPAVRAEALYRSAYGKAANATFVPIGDAAHFVMLDQPVAFAAALQAFADER